MEDKDTKINYGAFTPPKEHIIYRIKFTKGEEVKYISHLDLVRVFQRAIKRADFEIAYSKGFNPHQLLSFASPLTTGSTSIGEYADFEFLEKLDEIEIIKKFNDTLPKGIEVLSAELLEQKVKNCMASVTAADYEVVLDKAVTPKMLKENIEGYFNQSQILIMKKTKRNLIETDIKPDIFKINNISDEKNAKLYVFVATGSQKNLKPQLVVESLYNYMGIDYNLYKIKYKRINVYKKENEKYISLCGKMKEE